MVFPANPIPSVDHPSVDPSDVFTADVPFDVKQGVISTRRHRWFDVRNIGDQAGPYSNADGLSAGATMRIAFDNRPDWIIVSISGRTAATGRVKVYRGEPGGSYVRLGPHGKYVFPAGEAGVINIVNEGSTATWGTVVAMAGFVDPGVDVTSGD